MANPYTFAIHRNFPYRVDTMSELICTVQREEMAWKYVINISVFSVFILCMWFVSYRYHFIVFNASVLYIQTVCPLLQPGWCRHLVPSLRQVVQSLEEVADQDHSWRAELMMQVTWQCCLVCFSWTILFLILSCLICWIHRVMCRANEPAVQLDQQLYHSLVNWQFSFMERRICSLL